MMGVRLLEAKEALLTCGSIRNGDIVYLCDGNLGKVVSFWASSLEVEAVVVFLQLYTPDPLRKYVWLTRPFVEHVVAARSIIDAVMWAHLEEITIRVVLPFTITAADGY